MTPNPPPPGNSRKWVSKLTAIARAIQDTTKEDPIARRELTQSKIGNWIQGVTLVVAAVAALFAYLAYHTAKDQLVQTTRAWVGPFSFKNFVVQAGEPIQVTVTVKNGGPSPALDVVSKARMQSIDRAKGENALSYDYTSAITSRAVLQPDQEIAIRGTDDEPFSELQLARLKDPKGDYKVYIHGVISYTDIFKTPHTTEWCVWINPDLTSVKWCEMHNTAN